MNSMCCISIVVARIRWPERVVSHMHWLGVASVNGNESIPGPLKEVLLDTCKAEEVM